LCAAPRSLSQLTTSFIASQSQGIHHTPLVALKKLPILPGGRRARRASKSHSVLQLYSQYVKELAPATGLLAGPGVAMFLDSNQVPALTVTSKIKTKELSGGYRNRTDDP
jgi:hypothetical protein